MTPPTTKPAGAATGEIELRVGDVWRTAEGSERWMVRDILSDQDGPWLVLFKNPAFPALSSSITLEGFRSWIRRTGAVLVGEGGVSTILKDTIRASKQEREAREKSIQTKALAEQGWTDDEIAFSVNLKVEEVRAILKKRDERKAVQTASVVAAPAPVVSEPDDESEANTMASAGKTVEEIAEWFGWSDAQAREWAWRRMGVVAPVEPVQEVEEAAMTSEPLPEATEPAPETSYEVQAPPQRVAYREASHKLRDILFAELDDLRAGRSNPQRAAAVSKLASQIIGTLRVEVDVTRQIEGKLS